MTSVNLKEARIAKLNQAQETRKQECLNRVNQALERLKQQGTAISFASVAEGAGVSVSYLYKYPEVKARIAELRNSQSCMPRKSISEPASDQSHQKIVSRLKERNRKLESEITELKRKNEALAGQVYRVHELEVVVERQSQRIKDLEDVLRQMQLGQPQTSSSKITVISGPRKLEVSELIRSEVKGLGINLSKTLTAAILKQDEPVVLEAMAAYKQYQEENTILNPNVCLLRAIEGSWVRNQNQLGNLPLESTDDFGTFYREAVEAGFLIDVPSNYLPSDSRGQPLVKVNRQDGLYNWTTMPWKEAKEEFCRGVQAFGPAKHWLSQD